MELKKRIKLKCDVKGPCSKAKAQRSSLNDFIKSSTSWNDTRYCPYCWKNVPSLIKKWEVSLIKEKNKKAKKEYFLALNYVIDSSKKVVDSWGNAQDLEYLLNAIMRFNAVRGSRDLRL